MSTEKRAATYGVFTAVLAALAAFGFIDAESQAAYTAAGGEALSALVMLMAAVKTWRQRIAPDGLSRDPSELPRHDE